MQLKSIIKFWALAGVVFALLTIWACSNAPTVAEDNGINPNNTEGWDSTAVVDVTADMDEDGIPDVNDLDLDGDGILNVDDIDIDGDGILNFADPDIDNDGLHNKWDYFAGGTLLADLNNSISVIDGDIDGDGIPNVFDTDMDGDGIENTLDPDIDGDEILNIMDLTLGGINQEVTPIVVNPDVILNDNIITDPPILNLDTVVITGDATSGEVDGSENRLIFYGEDQCFWGDGNNTGVDMPLVKIIHSVSNGVVDIAVIFSPYFVDNSYGTTNIGWKGKGQDGLTPGHKWRDLVGSDHVQLALVNGDGDTIFHAKLDYISENDTNESGYATNGPFDKDGEIFVGDESDVVFYGTSIDDNINYQGYHLFENSPATDSNYTPNPAYPNWEFLAVYRITLKEEAFGPSGYGSVHMTDVHASPSKTAESTIAVSELLCPKYLSDDDVFRFSIIFKDKEIAPCDPIEVDTVICENCPLPKASSRCRG